MSESLSELRLLTLLLAAPLVALVLLAHGAVPGIAIPTYGQSVWAVGFAQSMANHWSIFALDTGIPAPAPIAFGLPAVLTIAAFLKLGMNAADAYSAAFACWLVLAFWGAYRLCRQIGNGRIFGLVASATWMTMPVLWVHQGYSMLALGFSLLPFYVSCVWDVAWRGRVSFRGFLQVLASTLIAAFMDGYSFVMFAAVAGALWLAGLASKEDRTMRLLGLAALVAAFSSSYVLFSLYSGLRGHEQFPLDFYRAYGANIEFLLMPTSGFLGIFDLLGLSQPRVQTDYFGDWSVFSTSFSLVALVLAVWALFERKGDRRIVWLFLALGLAGFYLSLGPSFKWMITRPHDHTLMMPREFAPFPTGSALLAYLPGFSVMRASYRWVLLGIFSMWVVFVASQSGVKSSRGIALLLALVAILLHFPNRDRLEASQANRDKMLAVQSYVEAASADFRRNEKVLFLPKNNDFLAPMLASFGGFRTFNVGGDKNVQYATRYWPAEVASFKMSAGLPLSLATQIADTLSSKVVDVVALSFIDNFEPVVLWPVERKFEQDALVLADVLEKNPALSVVRTDGYVLVRLAN